MRLIFNICLFITITNSSFAQKEIIPIAFISAGKKLIGELVAPKQKDKKVPVIIFLIGSGEESSMERYRTLINYFFVHPAAMDNVAIIYFDKRGVGLSEGSWYETDFEQRALDAKNAAEHIKNYSFVNTNQMYVVGHSQGGWIVQICLAKYPETFAGGISMAGPTFSVKKQIVNSYQSDLICSGKYDSQKAYSIAKRKTREPLGGLFEKQNADNKNQQQLKLIRNFDPKAYLERIHKPLLFMWAQNDRLVNPDWCKDRLHQIFKGRLPSDFSLYVAEGENHSFLISDFCNSQQPKQTPFSEKSRDYMLGWLANVLTL
jgi:uncharacterized protein